MIGSVQVSTLESYNLTRFLIAMQNQQSYNMKPSSSGSRSKAAKQCSVSTMLLLMLMAVTCVMMIYVTKFGQHAVPTGKSRVSTPTKVIEKQNPVKAPLTSLMEHIKHMDFDNIPHISIPPRPRLAFIITITKDGFFQDGAAVLAYSIIKTTRNSAFDISFIAFVHPNVTTSRVGLRRLGFHVLEVPTPVNISAIKFQFLREHIDKNGCCGAAELIKLTSYRLTQYDRVIHLDADTIMTGPIDELYSRNYSLIYTTDPNMASHKGEDKMPVQGGFLIMQPSEQDYRNMIDIVLNTEFAQGGAWNRSKIGWCWGGMTVQGLLPYYYNRVTRPGRTQVLDRCIYNTMADTPECILKTIQEVKSAHFTVCQKPWGCWKQYDNQLCGALHRRWFELRKEAEAFFHIPVTPNACPKGGHKHYIPMQLEGAYLSYNESDHIVPDDSKEFWEPPPEAKFVHPPQKSALVK